MLTVPVCGSQVCADKVRGLRPIQMLLTCPACRARHIDEGEFATKLHHTHACQKCGMVWRPAIEHTLGVRFLPGFKNEEPRPEAAQVEEQERREK